MDRTLIALVMLLELVLVTRSGLPLLFRAYIGMALAMSTAWLVALNPTDGAKIAIPISAWLVGLGQASIGVAAAHRITRSLPSPADRLQFYAVLWAASWITIALAFSRPETYPGYPPTSYYPRLFGACFGFACAAISYLLCRFDKDPRGLPASHAVIVAVYLGAVLLGDRAQWASHRVLLSSLVMVVHLGCMVAWLRLYPRSILRISSMRRSSISCDRRMFSR
jgi:hypothetical protein